MGSPSWSYLWLHCGVFYQIPTLSGVLTLQIEQEVDALSLSGVLLRLLRVIGGRSRTPAVRVSVTPGHVSPFTPSPRHSAATRAPRDSVRVIAGDQGNKGSPVATESRQGNFLLPRL